MAANRDARQAAGRSQSRGRGAGDRETKARREIRARGARGPREESVPGAARCNGRSHRATAEPGWRAKLSLRHGRSQLVERRAVRGERLLAAPLSADQSWSAPPMYGRSTVGTLTEPSAFW